MAIPIERQNADVEDRCALVLTSSSELEPALRQLLDSSFRCILIETQLEEFSRSAAHHDPIIVFLDDRLPEDLIRSAIDAAEADSIAVVLACNSTAPSDRMDVFDQLQMTDDREVLAVRFQSILRRATEYRRNRGLESRLRYLEKALETTQLGVTVTDIEGQILYSNPADARLHGYEPGELVGRSVSVFTAPAHGSPHESVDLHEMSSWQRESINIRKNGETFPVRLLSDVVRGADGEPAGIVTTCEDITERKEQEEARIFLEKAVETMQQGVTITDLDGKILFSNPAEAVIHGYATGDLLGRDVRMLAPKARWAPLDKEQIRAMNSWHRESVNVRLDTSEFPVRLLSDAVLDAHGEPLGIVTTCEDITDRRRAEEELHFAAFHDSLTGLANRDVFIDHLRLAIHRKDRRSGQIFAVLFVDVDRFKTVNDSLGHLQGDLLLVKIAQRLCNTLRPTDTIARLGGDEFAILVEDLENASEVEFLARRLQKTLARPFDIGARELSFSASIGIALSSSKSDRPEDYLRDADTAMYRAKAEGRARYRVFDQTMHASAVARLEIEAGLRSAVRRGELRIHYQPIVDLGDGSIEGFEALVRWQHPSRGLLGPLEFMRLAEETHLVVPIGEWILRTACEQFTDWSERFDGFENRSISVNLSARRLSGNRLLRQLREILDETSLGCHQLRVEITESAIMENPEEAATLLATIRDLGIKVCLDDFGTGYSSLSYLHRFPIDVLKIDRSFVSRMEQGSGPLEIVRTILTLARELGMDTVAEGIETKAQAEQLHELGCGAGQGYYFSRPVDIPAAEGLIENQPFR